MDANDPALLIAAFTNEDQKASGWAADQPGLPETLALDYRWNEPR